MELTYKDLKRFVFSDLNTLKNVEFDSIECDSIIGQEKAETAIKFGLSIDRSDYNIYITGSKGTGRTSYAERFAKEKLADKPVPEDMCFVYNFKEPKCPTLLKLKAGEGIALKQDVEELVSFLKASLTKTFSSKAFEDEKAEILKEYQNQREEVIQKISENAKKFNFGVKLTNSGVFFMPVVDGEPLSEEDFEKLSDEEKKALNKTSEEIQANASNLLFDMNIYETNMKKKLDDLEFRTAVFVLGRYFAKLLEKYHKDKEISDYLISVREDLLGNVSDLLDEDSDSEENTQNFMPWMIKRNQDNPLSKYAVNVFVDNSKLECAPVIVVKNASHTDIIGEIEYDSEFGNLTADFMKIKSGLLHRANGGVLILQEEDVITSYALMQMIKRVANTGEAIVEPLREYTTGLAIASVKPKKIKLNIKFIIVGSNYIYSLLNSLEEDFIRLFKVNASFDSEIRYNNNNLMDFIGFVNKTAKKENLPKFEMCAVSRLVEEFLRQAESKNKLSSNFNALRDCMVESAFYSDGNSITENDVLMALAEKTKRNNLYEEKLSEMIAEGIIMIETDGGKVGQINGLSVISLENHSFGKPSKISATTYVGKAGIINIEKEAEMSGSIHDKGIEVISGYLGQRFAQNFPLSLSCRICFEQNYSGIDGDSASSTELYAVISSLSGLEIKQAIAVTGSVNQAGEIQPIGGINYKIEGFFDVCKSKGLTGTQGVIIPHQNTNDLMLKDEVIEAVKNGVFHVYSVKTIAEGLEILTGEKIEIINDLVEKKLNHFYKSSVPDSRK